MSEKISNYWFHFIIYLHLLQRGRLLQLYFFYTLLLTIILKIWDKLTN